MRSSLRRFACSSFVAGVAGIALASSASAFTLQDNYTGGVNTYNNPGDVIGTQTFDTTTAVITRSNANQTLNITINTWFAGAPGTAAADGTGYGSLFLSPGLWAPNGSSADGYSTDTYAGSNHSVLATTGEWQYAVTIPTAPSTNSGTGGLYSVGTLNAANTYPQNTGVIQSYTTSTGSLVMSNVNGDPVTYPGTNNPAYYFRQGQAVQFNPTDPSIGSSTWSVTPSNGYLTEGSITFVINDDDALGNNFALAWAMTCANDVIQGQVNLAATPLPAALPLFASAMGLGFVALRRKKKVSGLTAAG